MNIGVMVDSLAASQLCYYFIDNTNKFLAANPKASVFAFYEELSYPCIFPEFSFMQIFEAWGFNGTLIATNLTSAAKLCRFTATDKKFFYVWDLEWTRHGQREFAGLETVYRNSSLRLIARSNDHARVIENCWNTKVHGVVNNFDYNQLLEIINGSRTE
jgi:hypothetical protein